ncbi:potassium transporter, partial [Vibrio kanaloae]
LIEAAQSAVTSASDHHEELSLVAGLPGWAYGLVITASIAIVVVGGHFLSRPLFRFVASSGLREIFTATALMLVIGIAALMSLVGLSPALGTFLAGVVLANSEFRHELESNIDPFKGLLLGLFFITVGAGINFDVLFNDFILIIGL